MAAIWNVLYSWIPNSGLRLAFLGIFAIICLLLILRIIKIVLDAIPFL